MSEGQDWIIKSIPFPTSAWDMIADAYELGIERGTFAPGIYGLAMFIEACVADAMPEIVELGDHGTA